MKLRYVWALSVMALLAVDAGAQSVKVGVVNIPRIERESASSQRANNALVAEFEPRNKQIAEFQKKIAAQQNRLKKEADRMSPAERQALEREIGGMMRQSDQTLRALTDELEMRRKELQLKIVEEARAAIKAVAEAGKYDLIVQEAAFVRGNVDVTDQVLKEMARRGGAR